jgi:hypothetical protein
MKQILIEKYIEPSERKIGENSVFESWFNKYGDLHSSMGQPAFICYKEQVLSQSWYKKGVEHRDRDLPSYIGYSNGQVYYQEWYKNGELIKEQ